MNTAIAFTEDERTTAIGLARYAYDYIQAARVVDAEYAERWPNSSISPIPAYFLVYHGIELTLKSYLRHRGITVRELGSKKYGHDLHSCCRKAKELGLLELIKAKPINFHVMEALSNINQNHGLRYIKTGAKTFPLWSEVESLAVSLHQFVAPTVGYKTFAIAFG